MQRLKLVAFSLIIALGLASLFTVRSFAADEGTKTITGTVICLIPDYKKGTVNPVIATGPCNTLPPHQHVLMTKEGTVYSLQGLQDGLMKIEEMPNKTDVTITGKVEGNNYGWILFVD
jgi:hypothetical protein